MQVQAQQGSVSPYRALLVSSSHSSTLRCWRAKEASEGSLALSPQSPSQPGAPDTFGGELRTTDLAWTLVIDSDEGKSREVAEALAALADQQIQEEGAA